MVSIITPVYNGEKFLSQTIDSVLAQDYENWELVVVDDGSIDNTAQIVKAYPNARIRYQYQVNRGQAAALNHGLRLASGEYITTLDADDWYPPNSLSARIEVLKQHPDSGVVYGDGMYCDAAGKPMLRFSEQMPSGSQGDVYDLLIVSPFYGTGAGIIVRRSVFETHGITYDERIDWCQDWDIYIRVAEKVHFCFSPDISINYRIHYGGMTQTMPGGRRLESLIRLRYKVLQSERFSQTNSDHKAAFFYDFLVRDLHNRLDDQEKIFSHPRFTQLPLNQQSRLIRLSAVNYLLAAEKNEFVKKWLSKAWQVSRRDKKSMLAMILVNIHPGLAKKIIGKWHHAHNATSPKSPMELGA